MDNLSSKQMRDIGFLYESIYQEKQETAEIITEEDFCHILAIEICNALIEEGLLEGEVITETTIKEGKLGTAWRIASDVVKPVIKQVTGLGTNPKTRLGKNVRDLQKVGFGAALSQPVRTWNTVTGALKGAFTGAVGGATQPTGGGPIDATQRAIRAAQGESVPAAPDKRKQDKPNLDLTPEGTIRVRR